MLPKKAESGTEGHFVPYFRIRFSSEAGFYVGEHFL